MSVLAAAHVATAAATGRAVEAGHEQPTASGTVDIAAHAELKSAKQRELIHVLLSNPACRQQQPFVATWPTELRLRPARCYNTDLWPCLQVWAGSGEKCVSGSRRPCEEAAQRRKAGQLKVATSNQQCPVQRT